MTAAAALTVSYQGKLRCLNAHERVGKFTFDPSPIEAQRHYEISCDGK